MQQTILLLADGTCFPGKGFGHIVSGIEHAPIAEVVFNTSMTGYQEILTDPSYNGQMVTMTYPHMGNYGTEPDYDESRSIKATAMIVHELYDGPLPEGRTSLASFMEKGGCAGIEGVNTRKLTLHLRDLGSCNAMLLTMEGTITEEDIKQAMARLKAFPSITERDLIDGVTVKEPVVDPFGLPSPMKGRFAVIDFGIKESIIKELNKRGIAVTLLPATATKEEVLATKCDALFLSNGPGDPALLKGAVAMTKRVIGTMPVMGICLGHQIITWALGGKTVKMKFGHHGANHPVYDQETGKTFVTSQNHGFMSDPASLPSSVSIWFTNANDGSIEGIKDQEKQVASVQFHPEASPGPHDAAWIFDTFAAMGASK